MLPCAACSNSPSQVHAQPGVQPDAPPAAFLSPSVHAGAPVNSAIGIFSRSAGVKTIRWYTCPVVAMQTHTFNAWEEGDMLHLDHFVTGSGCAFD